MLVSSAPLLETQASSEIENIVTNTVDLRRNPGTTLRNERAREPVRRVAHSARRPASA